MDHKVTENVYSYIINEKESLVKDTRLPEGPTII